MNNELEALNTKLHKLQQSETPRVDGIAPMSKEFIIHFSHYVVSSNKSHGLERKDGELNLTWNDIFSLFGSRLIAGGYIDQDQIARELERQMMKTSAGRIRDPSVFSDDVTAIIFQLVALGLLEPSGGQLRLTDSGLDKLLKLKAIYS